MDLISLRALSPVFLFVLVAACSSVPRGAGFQSEVLAASNAGELTGEDLIYDFAVFEISRDILPTLAHWPQNGSRNHQWINRQVQPASSIIAPGDVLDVAIWDAEENSLLTSAGQRVARLQAIAVNSDGRIFIPFVGNMKVSGMSPQTARAQIETQLIATIPSAQVQISVVPGRANTANLVGGVSAPGVYPLPDRDYTLLSLLAQGGGVRSNIKSAQVQLMRGPDVYGISLERLYADPKLDTTLIGGDLVVVEEDDRYFLSLGATGSEALHNFPKDRVTALDALAIVGGVSDARGDPQGILILREYAMSAVRPDLSSGPPQTRVVFTMDLTTADGLFSAAKFDVQSGDLVYATENPVNAAQTVLSIFGSVLGIAKRF
jgi:polysaccharide export outer membrane protein